MTETPAPPDLSKAVPPALRLGWTMAVLYGVSMAVLHGGDVSDSLQRDQLRSEHELDPRGRLNLEMTRLVALVQGLNGAGSAYEGKFSPNVAPVMTAWWGAPAPASQAPPGDDVFKERVLALNEALPDLNLSVLTETARCGLELELGYQTGRSLRDSVDPPAYRPAPAAASSGTVGDAPASASAGDAPATAGDAPATAGDAGRQVIPLTDRFRESLDRDRVAIIQEGLTVLAPHFPVNAAKIVSSSLGRWSDLAQVTLVDGAPGRLRRDSPAEKDGFAGQMRPLLLRQGDTWLALLIGEQTTSALLSPEGYVAAGDAALRRTAQIIGKVAWRYKWALLVLLAVLGVVLAGAATYLGGASKLWTSIAAFAGTIGITWKGIANGIPKLAGDAERPIFGLEEVEAMAWSITTLPAVKATRAGVNYLRSSGTGGQAPLGSA